MSRLFRTFLLLFSWLYVSSIMAETASELRTRLSQNTYYRLKSYYDKYAVDGGGKTISMNANSDLTNAWNSIWKIVPAATGYTLQNVLTGNYLNDVSSYDTPLPVLSTSKTFYITPSSFTSPNKYVVISWTSNAATGTVVHAAANGNVVRWSANTSTTANNASDWILEPISSIDQAALDSYKNAITPQAGAYYYIVSKAYPGKQMQSPTTATAAIAADANDNEYRQLWKLEQIGTSKYAFRNAVTGFYLQNNATQSGTFNMGALASPFGLSFSTGTAPFWFTAMGANFVLHAAESQSYQVVGWYADSEASKWFLKRATVTEADVQAAIAAMQEAQNLIANSSSYTAKMPTFFEDVACTQLKSTYSNMSDTELRNALASAGLPVLLQDMAVRVKNNQWNSQSALANQYEKSFRISNYIPHSDPNKWAQRNDLMRTSFIYSQLTSPTGITANPGDIICLFVSQAPPPGTTLQAEMATGINRTGRQVALQAGVNFIYAEGKEHVYIRYNIDEPTLRIADLPEIKIHIENGRANGYFDLSKHNNQAWRDMLTLKDAGFMQDDEWRMKSKRYTYIFKRSDVEQDETNGNYTYRGEYKGLTGVLSMWDKLCEQQLDFLSLERYADRFNCVLLAVNQAGGNLYATNYGIYGITALKYKDLVESSENSEGEGIWGLVHETGHHFQQLFNMQGALESSNNLFSNIALWRTGTNVSRGMSLPTLINNCVNSGNSWMDIGLSERMRLYWQLYLYYVELGHKPTFFQELMDKFRNNPMQSGNGRTDFLLFAKYCSEVAGEDLTEFFECYGFFKKTGSNLRIMWGDPFYDSSYAQQYTNVTQADIDETKQFMAQYTKKRNNLFFIDDRIRLTEGKNEYMLPGASRYGTSSNATPGDVNEVGDVGHYTDFAAEKPAKPYSVQLQERTFTVTGESIVGYKVYDVSGNLVYMSNRNSFEIPATLNLANLRVVAAGSDGADITLYENGAVKSEYNRYGIDCRFVNTAALALSANESQPEYLYTINLSTNANGYLNGNTTTATSEAERGEFAFYPGTTEGAYYIYSFTARKWLGYANANVGNNKVVLTSGKGSSSQWLIKRESEGGSNVDIMPLGSSNGWNWYGGINAARTSMGFYNINDPHSSWTLTPANIASKYEAIKNKVEDLLNHRGAGYPATTASIRTTLQNKLTYFVNVYATYQNALSQGNQTAIQTAYNNFVITADNLNSLAQDYIASTDVTLPENGKIYRMRYVNNNRAITNYTMPDDAQHSITLAPCNDDRGLWVCQGNADGTSYFASMVGDGILSIDNGGSAGALKDTNGNFMVAHGNRFGALYLRNNGYSLMGNSSVNYLMATTEVQIPASNKTQSTDFYFEEVADSVFTLEFSAGTNGNLATVCLPYAVILPEGIKAYTATREPDRLLLNEENLPTGDNGLRILPAYTAVVLSATESGTKALSPATAVTSVGSTGMEGTISQMSNDELNLTTYHYYTMIQDNGTFVMRKISDSSIPANQAYYRLATSVESTPPALLAIALDNNTSGIDGIAEDTDATKNNKTYDLSGRPVQDKAHRGIYVSKGKKVIKR